LSICKSKSPSSLNSRILLSYLGGITGSIVLLYCIVTRVEFVDGAVSKVYQTHSVYKNRTRSGVINRTYSPGTDEPLRRTTQAY
jgi:hypothetical protein